MVYTIIQQSQTSLLVKVGVEFWRYGVVSNFHEQNVVLK
jgi:hypothetical protein